MASRRRTWLLVRLAVYVAVIATLALVKGGVGWRRIVGALKTDHAHPTLVIAGRDLAPELVDVLVGKYRLDYPDLELTVRGGGTNQALQDLINGRADVAFLYRKPDADEMRLFRAADGDTAIVVPVAMGGIVLLSPQSGDTAAISLPDLDAMLAGGPSTLTSPLYVPDPNDGLWQSFRGEAQPPASSRVVLLADAGAVLAAAREGGGAMGLASTLTLPADLAAAGVRAASLVVDGEPAPVAPTPGNLAAGRYPLRHRLYAACRATGGIEAGKFLTHLAGGRAQRQVERAGYLPDSRVLRDIVLTRHPVGD
ncbi:MAG: substrate-binding domain-containing protein [bacterium]|nr:substrate-binding domain-containing protein [bacterium]